MQRDTSALLAIDVQVGMDDPSRPPRNNPQAEANIARLLAAFRQAGRPCVHIRHDALEPDSPFAPGKPGHPIKDIVAPQPGDWLVVKHVNSAFIGTDLEALLRGAGITTLVVTGTAANYCVESTARTASNLGFDTVVVSDATASWDCVGSDGVRYPAALVHAMSMMNLHSEFATVVTTEQIVDAMMAPRPASLVEALA